MKLSESTWQEVESYLAKCPGILIPIGSTEQHGPVGLIGTDSFCASAIAEASAEFSNALVAPPICFTPAQFNETFPGTISISSSTLMQLVSDMVHSLARQGFQYFYFLNGHGANLAPLKAVCHDLTAEFSRRENAAKIRFRIRSWWDYSETDSLRNQLYGVGEGLHGTPSEIAITRAFLRRVKAPSDLKAPPPLTKSFIKNHAGDFHLDADHHRNQFPDGRVGSDSDKGSASDGQRFLEVAAKEAASDYLEFLEES
ncbi:MAG: creatininase family protein [SAR324 cluster bacterium]|nr:creatininase family protein [SAR324 cluster bacterium]